MRSCDQCQYESDCIKEDFDSCPMHDPSIISSKATRVRPFFADLSCVAEQVAEDNSLRKELEAYQ